MQRLWAEEILRGSYSFQVAAGRAPRAPPGAKTASHALKCGRPHFANWGLPRFRAQKHDFAPEGLVREDEFEYVGFLRFRMGDDLVADNTSQTGVCFFRRLASNPNALVEITHLAMELGDQETGSFESLAQLVHNKLAALQDALRALRCRPILPSPISVIEGEQPHEQKSLPAIGVRQ